MRRLAWIAAALLLGCGRSPPAPGKTAGSVPSNGSLTEGEAQYWRDQFDSARVIFRTALAEAEAHADSANQARALTWLSRAAYRLGDYEAARRDGERGLDFKVRLGLAKELFESWNTLGLLAWNQGRLVEAESLLTEASRAAAATGDQLGVGKAAANRGLVLVELGDYVGARAGFEAMHAAGQVFQDARVAGNALANLAMLDIREGDPRSSIPRLIEARRLYGRANYSTGEANALGQLATAWRDMGDYQAALAASDSAVQLARRLGLRQEEAAELEVIATLHRETGDFAAALRRLSRPSASTPRWISRSRWAPTSGAKPRSVLTSASGPPRSKAGPRRSRSTPGSVPSRSGSRICFSSRALTAPGPASGFARLGAWPTA